MWCRAADPDWLESVHAYAESGGDLGASHPVSGWTLLHVAAEMQNVEVIRYLVAHGISPDARDRNGDPVLHHAADSDIDGAIQNDEPISMTVTKALLQLGADIEIRDSHDRTIREVAALYGDGVLAAFDAAVDHVNTRQR